MGPGSVIYVVTLVARDLAPWRFGSKFISRHRCQGAAPQNRRFSCLADEDGTPPARRRCSHAARPTAPAAFSVYGQLCDPGLTTRTGTGTERKDRSPDSGVSWDSSGTSGTLNGHERETTERSSMLARAARSRPHISAGHWGSPVHSQDGTRALLLFSNTVLGLRRTCPDLPPEPPDTPSERASNERHERPFSVKISPVTPTSHIMRTSKTAGQEPFAAGSRMATHST